MSARQLSSHAATHGRVHARILVGLTAALILCEIASSASVTPDIIAGGLAPLVALPFFGPSLLAAFASQLLLRPRRAEILTSIAIALAAAVPIFLAASGPYAVVNAAASALGVGSLVSLGMAALRSGADERAEVVRVLLPAAILPGFVVLAHPMIYLTAALWPTTYDHRMYLADAAFGAPLSFVVGQWTAAVPWLGDVCLLVYVCLPLALMLVHAQRTRAGVGSSDALVTFVAVTVVGYLGYHVVPVTGPVYVFGGSFPQSPPDPATLDAARTVALAMPRNCMPSLHSAWALVVWWSARPLVRWQRGVAAVFLAITLLATVGLGFHYVVDLVAAFPLTLAVRAWATRTADARRRRTAIAAGAAMTLAWIAFVTWSDAMLRMPEIVLWTLAVTVVAVSCFLERRIPDQATGDEPAADAAAPWTWPPCAAAIAFVLLGFALRLHHEIVTNALVLVVGSTSGMRMWLALVPLAGVAAGLAVSPSSAARAVSAMLAAAIAVWSWLAVAMLPWIAGHVAGAGIAVSLGASSAMLFPGAFAGGMLVGAISPRLAADEQFRSGLGLSLAFTILGAGIAALAAAYLVRPTVAFAHVPIVATAAMTVVAAALAAAAGRASSPMDGEESAAGPSAASAARHALFGPHVASSATGLVAGVLLATIAHLLAAVLGDTVYSRDQIVGVAAVAVAIGAIAARRDASDRETQERWAWAMVAMIAVVALAFPVWTNVPGYFASFEGYVEKYRMMTVFRQREFVRLMVAVLFVAPVCFAAGAATMFATGMSGEVARRPLRAGLPAAIFAFATGTVIAKLGLSGIGSRATLVVTGGVALLIPAIALLRSEDRNAALAVATGAVATCLLLLAPMLDVAALVSTSGLRFRAEPARRIVEIEETADGVVAREKGANGDVVSVNGLPMRSADSMAKPGGLAASLPSERRTALVIGVAGSEATAALREAGFARVVVAEPMAALRRLAADAGSAVDFVPADGRRALEMAAIPFDYVRIDEPEVSVPESAALSTKDFYGVVARHLAGGGVLEQRLRLERLSAVALTSIVTSVRQVFADVRLYFAGDGAAIVACVETCGEAGAFDTPGAARSGWLDSAAVDRMLASVATKLSVSPEALATTDRDMFLAYQAPYSFVSTGAEPESARLLATFARTPAARPAIR